VRHGAPTDALPGELTERFSGYIDLYDVAVESNSWSRT
jgi:hypothetical protein